MTHANRLFIALQHCMPKHLLSTIIALESWGAAQSAKTAALQVTTKNTAARALTLSDTRASALRRHFSNSAPVATSRGNRAS